jgi:putative intracellular protease/amidase
VGEEFSIQPDLLLHDVRAADYHAIYFCGGEGVEVFAAGGEFSAQIRRLIRDALAADCIVSANGLGVVVLAEAGVLRGRQAACYPYGKPPGVYVRRIENCGVLCTSEPTVDDGPFLTGRAPQDVQRLIRGLLKRLNIEPRPPPSCKADSLSTQY